MMNYTKPEMEVILFEDREVLLTTDSNELPIIPLGDDLGDSNY